MDLVCKLVNGVKCVDDHVEYKYNIDKAQDIIRILLDYMSPYVPSRKYEDGIVYEKYISLKDPAAQRYEKLAKEFKAKLEKRLDSVLEAKNLEPTDDYDYKLYDYGRYGIQVAFMPRFGKYFDSEIKPFLLDYLNTSDVFEIFDYEVMNTLGEIPAQVTIIYNLRDLRTHIVNY